MNANSAANVASLLEGTVATDMKVVFAIDDGTDTFLWYFDASAGANNDTTVDADELTLIGVLDGVDSLATNGDSFNIV